MAAGDRVSLQPRDLLHQRGIPSAQAEGKGLARVKRADAEQPRDFLGLQTRSDLSSFIRAIGDWACAIAVLIFAHDKQKSPGRFPTGLSRRHDASSFLRQTSGQ